MIKGYVGVSVVFNWLGLSYIFYNYIYDLGDECGWEWIVIKVGGLMFSLVGKMFILENYIIINRNVLVFFWFRGDNIMWVDVRNNIFIMCNIVNNVGFVV